MDNPASDTVFRKTAKGMRALGRKDRELSDVMARVLSCVDGKTKVGAIAKRLENLPLPALQEALGELLAGEFIRVVEPSTVSLFGAGGTDEMDVAEVSIEEFLAIQAEIAQRQETEGKAPAAVHQAPAEPHEDAAARQAEAAAREARLAEEARVRARRQAEEKARAEEQARAREEAERRAREEIEARRRAEAAARERAEAEERARRASEEKARAEALAAEKARREAEETERKAHAEAEEKARQAAEAEAEEKARRAAHAEALARAEEAERKARQLAAIEHKAREVALYNARKEARARKRAEAENKKREKAAHEARAQAEKKARKEAEAQSRAQRREAWRERLRRALKPGRGALVALCVLFAVLLLLPFLSLPFLVAPIERLALERVHENVRVTAVHAALLPSPRLRLDGVTLGEAGDAKIAELRVVPALASIFAETWELKTVEADGLFLGQDALARLPDWAGVRGGERVRVGRIVLKDAQIEARGIAVPHLDGEIFLTPQGRLEKARVSSVDGKLNVNVTPRGDGEFNLAIRARDWQPPLWPGLSVDELDATAVAGRDGLDVGRLDGSAYGGTFKGVAALDWRQGWRAEGTLQMENVGLSGLMHALGAGEKSLALSGRLDATLRYTLHSAELAGLLDAPRLQGTFTCRDGAIQNLDLGRGFRVRERERVMGGATRFGRLTGTLSAEAGRYRFHQLRLTASQMAASGEAEVAPDGRLSGSANVDVAIAALPSRSRLTLGGRVQQPELH